MRVYSYKMRTDQWELCPQDYYFNKIIISKDDTSKRYEKDVKSLWEYFHKRLKDTHKKSLCETFYIDNIETPIIYGSGLTSDELTGYLFTKHKQLLLKLHLKKEF